MMVRKDVADLLRAGATYAQIKQQLHVTQSTISRTRTVLQIPLPAGRTRRSREEMTAARAQAIAMLRAGATSKQVYEATRVGPNDIARLRRQHNIPVPARDPNRAARHTVDEAFALHARDTDDGHVLWTGPRSGRSCDLIASGRRYNARRIAFRRHRGRDPQGRLWRTCDEPACIAGAHHTDRLIRQANARADRAYTAIFGDTP